jgi:benzoate membrane transport protein
MQGASLGVVELARPVFQRPVWTLAALAELVLPLAITVLVVQNGQGIAVLRAAGHDPPVNVLTVASGIGAIASAAVGAVSSCLTGPTNAILVSSGERARQYTAGLTFGLLCVVFGLLSPVFTRLMLQATPAFIATLAGLAMLRVLQSAFVAAFRERFALGALVAMLVTVADLGLWNIGAAFWGLLAGLGISALLEREDFAAARAER